ncbi:putative outer membrane protein [Mycobacterium triplex]|nr:putative outer membrane protein [Mycobacterium triplex]
MAQLVSDHSNNPDVVAFAAKTSTALQVDTQVLKALRAQWKESQDNPTGASGQPAAPSEPSSNATLAGLAAVRGAEFDTLWLNSMISLYQATIDLANREVANGKNVDATSLAKQIVEARQADIGQMRQLLAA